MNIRDEFTCKYCNEIFDDPVSLNCCGENVCKAHIDHLFAQETKNGFSCPLCSLEMPRQKFQINKVLNNLLKREIDQVNINPAYEKIYTRFREKISIIENMQTDPENTIYNKLSELKMQIDSDRESTKSEIDKLADEMIQKIDSYHKEFKDECKSDEFLIYSSLVKSMKAQLSEYETCLKSLKSTEDDRKRETNEIEEALHVLELMVKDFECRLFKNNAITYESLLGSLSYQFGRLHVSMSIFSFFKASN